ncbi:MAG: hypothetical protein ACREX6_07070, partial [Casimicrobiaceae bacterium]
MLVAAIAATAAIAVSGVPIAIAASGAPTAIAAERAPTATPDADAPQAPASGGPSVNDPFQANLRLLAAIRKEDGAAIAAALREGA